MDKTKIKFYLKEYFTFTKGEKAGIITIVVLIILVITVMSLLPRIIPEKQDFDVSQYKKEIEEFEKTVDSLSRIPAAGAPTATPASDQKVTARVNPVINLMELNSADSATLEKLPGIGPVLSARIIRYRNSLGGYYTASQLQEVYGLKPDIWQKIKNYVTVDTCRIQRVYINTGDFREVNAHPYISFDQTRAIFKYRSKNRISDLKQLVENNIFTEQEMSKLRIYLSTE